MNKAIKYLQFLLILILTINFFATQTTVSAQDEKRPEALNTCNSGNNIDVETNSGIFLAGYSTLGAAFNAINAGTHTGFLIIEICASTTEPAPATLNSTGAGAANYGGVSIYPIANNITISGSPAAGFGVIQLNGADNVTIEGDNPNNPGQDVNLTIQVNSAATTVGNSAVRIATSPGTPTANNFRINNVNINGNVTGGNSTTITSTTGSSAFSFGIYAGGGGGATATDAPTAITTMDDQALPGTTMNNFFVNNVTINRCAQGVAFNGSASSVSDLVSVLNTTIGDQAALGPDAGALPPILAPSTTVYHKGIYVQGATSVTLFRNKIKNIISFIRARNAGIEIANSIGSVSMTENNIDNIVQNDEQGTAAGVNILTATSYTIAKNQITEVWSSQATGGLAGLNINTAAPNGGVIDRNYVRGIWNTSTLSQGAFGININAGTGLQIKNNMISDLTMNVTGGGAFSVNIGLHGLRVAGGTNHKIFNNSVNMSTALNGPANPDRILSSAFTIVNATSTGLDVRNNIFANTQNTNGTNCAYVSMYLPDGADTSMNLRLDYNNYYSGTGARQGIAQVGSTPGVGFYKYVDFNPNNTFPSNNLRSYTAFLSPDGNNDFRSQKGNPQFTSATNLHIPSDSYLQDLGDLSTGVRLDYDSQIRTATPDIGADETNGVGPVLVDIAATDIVNPVNGQIFNGDANFTPQARFESLGTSITNDVMVKFTITGPGGYSYSNTQTLPVFVAGTAQVVTFAAAPTATASGVYNMTAEVTSSDNYPPDNVVTGTFTVFHPLAGSYSVPGDYPSLTNAGGLFEAINVAGVTGNITVNITDDLHLETGDVALNQIAGGFSMFVQASGAARLIEGNGPNSLIRLDGADNVTFSGLAFGPRGLTIRNNDDTSGSVVLYTNDASNNSIVSCNIEQNNLSPAISYSFGNTTGNDNNSVSDSLIKGISGTGLFPSSSIQSASASPAAANTGLIISNNQLLNFRQNGVGMAGGNDNFQITGNEITSDTNSVTAQIGLLISEAQGTNMISGNNIHGFRTSINAGNTLALSGIFLGNVGNTTVRLNNIYDLRALGGATGLIVGLGVNGGTSTNVHAYNNMISLKSFSLVTQTQYIGLLDNGQTSDTFRFDHNTVYMTGESGGIPSWAFLRSNGSAATTKLTNSIMVNVRFGGGVTHFAAGDQTPASTTFTANNNFYSGRSTAPNGPYMDFGTDPLGTPVTPLQWLSGTAQDSASNFTAAASFIPDNTFFSGTTHDLHLMPGAGPEILGAATSAVDFPLTSDIDGDPYLPGRNADIGADELITAFPGNPLEPGSYFNVAFAPGDHYAGTVSVRGQLHLNGVATPNDPSYLIDLTCNVFISGYGEAGYIAGKVRYNLCPAETIYNFPVGAGTGYSPFRAFTAAQTTFPSTLTVGAVDDFLPGLVQSNAASRYWTVEKTGTVTADLVMFYRDEDANGNEAGYKAFRRSGGSTLMVASTADPVGNTMVVPGVSNFSDWGIGTLVPTSANVSLSGTVRTAEGNPIRNVTLTLTGGNLTTPRVLQTGSFGAYQFSNLEVGSYVLTISAKRFRFNPATRVINLMEDELTDFVANSQSEQ